MELYSRSRCNREIVLRRITVFTGETTIFRTRIISMYFSVLILELYIQYRFPCKLHCVSDFLVSTWVATSYSD